MKAMIFAAGLGTRLKPLTDNIPKALVEVGGQTLLERNIKKLLTSGFNDIIVNVHHFGDKVIDYLESNDGFGANIIISDERKLLLDTGGAVKHAKPFLENEDSFLIYNVDIISDIDLIRLRDQHINIGAMATMAVRKRNTDRQILFDKKYLSMQGWTNLKTGERKPSDIDVNSCEMYAYSGIQMVNKDFFDLIPTQNKFSIIDYYLNICGQKRITFFDHSESKWFDIGSIEKLNTYLSVV